MNLQAEADFFHDIALAVSKLVDGYEGRASVSQHKSYVGDYATEVDIAVEKLIVAEINKRFPGDAILAEEGHSDTKIPDGRIWIIDPICGTSNLGRGMTIFCTNIALADNNQLIASCVVDHSQPEYFWSIGNQEVYINHQLFQAQDADKDFGVVVDVDFGALGNVDYALKKKHVANTLKLLQEPGWMIQSLNTSLGFAYTAIGKIDGFVNVVNNPWDICAASFLIQQAGGTITDIKGKPWNLESVGAIGASTPAVHEKLLTACL